VIRSQKRETILFKHQSPKCRDITSNFLPDNKPY